MVKISDWLTAFWYTVRKRVTSLWGRILTLSFLVSVVWWIIDREKGDDVYNAGKKFFTQTLPEWARQPIGEFWLLAFGFLVAWTAIWVVVVLFLAWRDNRPKKAIPEVEPEKPLPLSPDEEHKIQFARGFWRDVGDDASGDVEWLLLGVEQELVPKHRLAVHLMEPKNALERLRENLDIALDDSAQVPLDEVARLIVATFKNYMEGVRWLHDCSDTYGVNLEAEPHAARYRHWQGLHPIFVSEITKLSKLAGYAALRYPVQHQGATDIRFKKMEA